MKKSFYRLASVAALAVSILSSAPAQTDQGKKSYTFHGKVQAVSADGLTVDGEKVEGWMDAMTMKYKVDNPAVLKKVKPGDEISATVYQGDFSLHKVKVEKPGK